MLPGMPPGMPIPVQAPPCRETQQSREPPSRVVHSPEMTDPSLVLGSGVSLLRELGWHCSMETPAGGQTSALSLCSCLLASRVEAVPFLGTFKLQLHGSPPGSGLNLDRVSARRTGGLATHPQLISMWLMFHASSHKRMTEEPHPARGARQC